MLWFHLDGYRQQDRSYGVGRMWMGCRYDLDREDCGRSCEDLSRSRPLLRGEDNVVGVVGATLVAKGAEDRASTFRGRVRSYRRMQVWSAFPRGASVVSGEQKGECVEKVAGVGFEG